ncbi:hypothetical protein UFOVP687_44 [uncultured Caudovirales phage]|uniref:Uncharacterized protein n=1 Tax=uncultured Caudovirales phage TaxID=2100421 RepID=A0A6J5NGQ5_9CAUD|nr:hypothetical protein UFOVP414_13 [uncultured Caudovirales phage]CAB4157977.1 hypothetical protein UFOVP687_44 [uncultured Caudovirales phage]
MNRDDIIRMAEEAGLKFREHLDEFFSPLCDGVYFEDLEDFANLVAAAERERIKWDSIHSCHPECDKPVCVAMRKAVSEERESCAKLLDDLAAKDKLSNYYKVAALLIRERGAP